MPDSAPRNPTIYDVAARAGVSIATVSRVFRGSAPVAEATRRRVLQAVSELRFMPSRLGRSLAEGRHAANGIVFPDLAGPYFAEVVLGYEETAGELGRSVLILSTRGLRTAPEKVLDLAARVDGMVLFDQTVDDDVVGELAALRRPLVLLARPCVADAPSISTDNTTSAQALARHLLAHGHERFAFLGDPTASSDVAERWAGIARVVRDAGHSIVGPVRCGFDERSGFGAARQILSDTHRPHALACANDELALGAVLAAEDLGLRIPDDVAVTGWDDIMAARYARPALTTVRQPRRELGGQAARTLYALIDGEEVPRNQVLTTRLVVRASCGRHTEEDQR